MSRDGIEIAVQIRQRNTEVDPDVPTYVTGETDIDEAMLTEFDSEDVVETAMQTCVREVVAEWTTEGDAE